MKLGNTTKITTNQKASASVFILVFSAIFVLILSGLIQLALVQYALMDGKATRQRALDFAESGLEFFEWLANNDPADAKMMTSYTEKIRDPQSGALLGSFSLQIEPNLQCGVLQKYEIYSEGIAKSKKDRPFKRAIYAELAQPSVARYSYILDSDVWAGESRTIVGPYHSNGGIRMDGTNNSIVTSAKNSWICDSYFGCDFTRIVPGVFGSGPNSNLWSYPSDEKSFDALAPDFANLKNLAKNNGGIYLPEFTGRGGNDSKGYELVFKSNGSVDIYRVDASDWHWGYRREYENKYSHYYGWRKERNRIRSRTFLGNYNIPPSCSLIYSEEKLWIKGSVKGKVTTVAGRSSGTYKPEIVLHGNIDYVNSNGSDGISVMAQSYILIPEYSPNNMTLNGIFVASEGSFGRSYYENNKRGTLTINGTVVSKKRVGTAWTCAPFGRFCSGYSRRINSYDRFLRNDPPPFTPTLYEHMIYLKWRED